MDVHSRSACLALEAQKITESQLFRAGLFENSGSSHDQLQFASMMVKALQNVTILEITKEQKMSTGLV